MNFIKKIASKLPIHVDKHIVVIFIICAAVPLTILAISAFNLVSDPNFESIFFMASSTIRANMLVFGQSPFENLDLVYTIHPEQILSGESISRLDLQFHWGYSALGNHPYWRLNTLLTNFIRTSLFTLTFAGIFIGTSKYRAEKESLQGKNAIYIIGRQVFTAFLFVLTLLVVLVAFGLIIDRIRYAQVSGSEGMMMLRSLYSDIDGLWRPDLAYHMQAALGVFLHMFGLAVFGIFLGHIFKEGLIALSVAAVVFMYFAHTLTVYPIGILYYLERLSPHFILSIGLVAGIDGSLFVTILQFILYLAGITALSSGILHWRIKRLETKSAE
ncbi:MAG: hypothetical protein FWB98_02150 [Defluviitaleaceae bacterium]|nr:hypothetical protein [Defluviitaleaceae bacterium]